MTQPILTITLNPSVDKSFFISNFSINRDFRNHLTSVCAGGKGINASRALTRLGYKSIASGFVGGGSGNYIVTELKREGIAADFQTIAGTSRTSHAIIDPVNETLTRILEGGPQVSADEFDAFIKRYRNLMHECDYVFLAGRNIQGLSDGVFANLINIAKRHHVKTFVDTSGDALPLAIQAQPYMIKPNLSEASHIIGKPLSDSPELLIQTIEHFHSSGIEIVAISMGAKGAVVSNGKEILRARVPFKVKWKNTVGCGDSFTAGFFYGLSQKQGFRDCVAMAVACGTNNATTINPGMIEKNTVYELLPKVQITPL